MPVAHPLAELIARRGYAVIDGAMSTALEGLGCDLKDPLWTAKVLLEEPEKICEVHRTYFEAGANIAITASYQASGAALLKRGLSKKESGEVIRLSVILAQKARREFLAAHPEKDPRDYLVAGSCGPYGAYLANGAEYTGDYALTDREYRNFHELRMKSLIDAGADFLAFETQPRLDEARVLLEMAENLGVTAWTAFTLKDAERLPDGTPLKDAAAYCAASESIEAVGANCVAPALAAPAVRKIRAATDKPITLYPNSGEAYDPVQKAWVKGGPPDWGALTLSWAALGAKAIGGCCRTLPEDIQKIANALQSHS